MGNQPNQPLPGRTISAAFVRLLQEYLAAHGVDPARVPGLAAPASETVPIARWVELLERVSRRLDDPLLGLHLGQTIAPRHLGTLGYLLQAMPTLGAALKKLQGYQRLVYDQSPMQWHADDDGVELCWDAEDGLPGRLADDASISALIHYLRVITAGDAAPASVGFIHGAPVDVEPYVRAFGCPVAFGAPVTSVRYRLATLALPLRAADAELSALMERQAAAWLARLPEQAPLVDALRREIARQLHDGEPTLPLVAAALQQTSRSLQRRLTGSGTSFRRELETVRRLLAERWLRDTRLSVADVAQLVGYSEHSALTRGFRQWTGLTPERWRESVL